MADFLYKAFISYSHKDDRLAAWVLKKLESYRIPHLLRRRVTKGQPSLGKMFRDREELSATGDLDAKLLEALKASDYLIVVCSPSSARSSRVNQEIKQFITHRDSQKILCLIVDGEPNFETVGLADENGCIPPELRKRYLMSGQIPLAADMRPLGDGKHKALQKVIAGLLQVDLDELLQRDVRRKYHRMMAIAVTSFAFMLLTTGLMLRAYKAENEAQRAKIDALLQQGRAEDLLSFMLNDLAGTRLRKLGRVEVMDAVVSKVVDHYSDQDDELLSPMALSRKAEAYMQLGRLYMARDMGERADELFDYAYRTTSALMAADSSSPEAIFRHTSSLFWIGASHIYSGRYLAAEKAWRERLEYGKPLLRYQDHSYDVWSRLGNLHIHHGWALMELGRHEEAYAQFQKGLEVRRANYARYEENEPWLNNLAGGYYHLQWAQLYLSMPDQAYENALISNQMYKRISDDDPTDQRALGNYARSLRWRAEAEIAKEKYDDAETGLLESISMHRRLLAFEPDSLDLQYQACVSTTLLAEVYMYRGKTNLAQQILSNECVDGPTALSLSHFKVRNRFYGYRYELLKVQLDLGNGYAASAMDRYERLTVRFNEETEVVRASTKGKWIRLHLALQAVKLDDQIKTMPLAREELRAVVKAQESSFVANFPTTARALVTARKLTGMPVYGPDLAR